MLDRPPGGVFGNDTRDAITAAQTRLNDDPRIDLPPLKRDGLVNPAGPTEAATRRLAGEVIRSAPTVPKPQPPQPGTAPSPGGAAQTVATPSGPRPETLEQTVKRIAAKAPPPALPREPQMTADQTA